MSGINRPILLTGVHGRVGGYLLPLLQKMGDVVTPTRSELDLGDAGTIHSYVQAVNPRWIVNPAAYADPLAQVRLPGPEIHGNIPDVSGETAHQFTLGSPSR